MLLLHKTSDEFKQRLGKPLLILALFALLFVFAQPAMLWWQLQRLHKLSCSNGILEADSCLGKIWAHRVNSIKRADIIAEKLAGYETDIVWNAESDNFLVYHPPLEYKPITLESFLKEANSSGEIWFDVRSTPLEDSSAILNAFRKLEVYYQLKQKAIIEIYNSELAGILANNGYRVALNINPQWISNYSPADWLKLKSVMSPRIMYVSQEDRFIPVLETHFPGKKIITWSTSIKNYFNLSHLQNLVSKKNISVVLVNVKSRHYK